MLQQVWTKLIELEKDKGKIKMDMYMCVMHVLVLERNPYYHDDWTVVTLVQGCVFKTLDRHYEAEKCFLSVIERYAYQQHFL